MPVKVAIADDHVLFRKGLVTILELDDNIEVVYGADNGKELIDKVDAQPPDVILMDLKMPVMDGMEATKIIKAKYPEVKVLVLSMYDEEKFIIHCLELGANGYLLKNTDPDELVHAIGTVMAKDFYFNNHISTVMLKGLNQKKRAKGKPQFENSIELTKREQEVLELICKELTTPEMAEKLFISNRTVEGHRKNLLEKTGAKNTAGLVVFALKNELVEI
ncbi:response regulator transcription factor [Microscilla marina]|uniref:DNA-binding response regulator, LuxR family n=1 Tax=Microscilla marina ATCC 23134 TaxID=313606 RepID=A1ZYF0_MICM2|nr:response regulator transcription factor [Microscilla marina]EAY24623.1 DNA-binding response regulator, LuxR family [Microscilla marina ATCC 23134]